MQNRAQFVETTPERVIPADWFYPIFSDGTYARWQVAAAFNLLSKLGPGSTPLGYELISAEEAKAIPFVKWVRNGSNVTGVARYREYVYNWPERICVDATLAAEKAGAIVRNYTKVTKLHRLQEGGWALSLLDETSAQQAVVNASIVLNTAGIWIDDVNAHSEGAQRPGRKITGTKGVHIMLTLPPECAGKGITLINRTNQPISLTPWKGGHFFGPTETLYEGDIDDIKPLEEEIDWLVDELNFLLPGLRKFTRDDVSYAWAGVRPLTYDAALPNGSRSRLIHDLGAEGMPDVYALTGGPIMTHRSAGQDLAAVVQGRIPLSRPAQPLSFTPPRFPDNQNSEPVLVTPTDVSLADLRYAATHEHVTSLIDLLFRRVGLGWTPEMALPGLRKATEAVADILGWDAQRVDREIEAYRKYVRENHRVRIS